MEVERRTFLALLGASLLTAGCAAPAAAPPSAAPAAPAKTVSPPVAQPTATVAAPKPAATAAAAKPTAAPPPKPTAPAKPKDTIKVRLVQTGIGLTFATIYVANVKNLWAEEGLDLEWQAVQGGAVATAALINDEAQLMVSAATDPISGWEKGLPLFAVAGVSKALTMSVGIRKDWMQSKGVTLQTPLKDRVMALRGTRMGVSTVSGAPTQYVKFLIGSQGLDPEKDLEYLVVGQGAPKIAALRENRVDAFIGGVPDAETAELEGFGIVYINLAREVPIFADFAYEVLLVAKDFAGKNSETCRRAARAIRRANTVIQEDLPGAIAALQQALSGTSPQLIELAMKNFQQAYHKDALMSESMWKNAIDITMASGQVKQAPPAAEGELWTNRFLK